MHKTYSRVSTFLGRMNMNSGWLDDDNEEEHKKFISGLFENQKSSRHRSSSVSNSSYSEDGESAEFDDHDVKHNEEELAQPMQELSNEDDCEGDSEFESLFDPENEQNSVDSWLEEVQPKIKKEASTPVDPIIISAIVSKDSAEPKEGEGEGDLYASASSKRRDVCIKSILRSMRRYYCLKMETMTSYLRKEKKIKLKHQTLIKCTKQIVDELGLSSFGPNMAFYFSLFAYSCDMRKILEKCKANLYLCNEVDLDIMLINKAIQLINLIENALNRFSKKIFNRLIDIPEISYLIQHFLANGQESLEINKEFEECIKILDDKSKDVLAHLKCPERARIRSEFYISETFFLFKQTP